MRPDLAKLGKPLGIDPGHQVPELFRSFSGDEIERPDKPFSCCTVRRPGPDKVGYGIPLVRGCLLGLVPLHGLVSLRAVHEVDFALRALADLFYHVKGVLELLCMEALADRERHVYQPSPARKDAPVSGSGSCDFISVSSGLIHAQTRVMSSPLAISEKRSSHPPIAAATASVP